MWRTNDAWKRSDWKSTVFILYRARFPYGTHNSILCVHRATVAAAAGRGSRLQSMIKQCVHGVTDQFHAL